ncbi:cbb3-type cytochrome oxidase subunit 3 [Tranquillimonas alkanivorans]|uniref:Cbb3-type cytochrome oxidase component FixQ n=1 Tax=Tranquillimonas alkanivorans TaxID=441119 RepID=A0A1I5KH28_9RHOB|nr:cbb3-type cytochrome c oxidase subunit 3 [Tranquillimonas alkanivorans]SFO84329.1 Cbb3-type cytochrome oxidase component FixQ [Tranquillimonas alkanivorans]
MNYHILREIADSWVLLALVLFFLGTIAWAFRPGSRGTHQDAGNVPFRHEDAPKPDCRTCENCTCDVPPAFVKEVRK